MVTAGMQKQKYTYYHCTGYRGKCQLPYTREEVLGERLGQILKDIHIPDDVVTQLQDSLAGDQGRLQAQKREQRERLQHRLTPVRKHIDQSYMTNLNANIPQ